MHYRSILSSLVLLALSAAVHAAIDLSDFDDEAMRGVEDATKELEYGLNSQDAEVTVANAEYIRDTLLWAQTWFENKGEAEAARLARDGTTQASEIVSYSQENNFAAAYESYNSLRRTCKRCHDAYKPPSL